MRKSCLGCLSLWLLGSVLCSPLNAAGPALVERAHLDQVLSGYIERGELVGVSALVFERGQEAYFGAFGMADREAGRPFTRDSLVQIYSMTKPLTGVTLMTFFEEGRFGLDDALADYLPEYRDLKVFRGLDADGQPRLEAPTRPPTIRDVMRHTAGFGNDDDSWVGERYRAANPIDLNKTLAEFSVALASVPLLYDPGTRWYYGPSVDVQARLVEVLSGQPFADVLRTRVLNPLGMRETRYTVPAEDRERLTSMYERLPDGKFQRTPDAEGLAVPLQAWPLTPGGWGLTATLDDYGRFARMLLNGGELDGVRILQPETVRLMATDALPDTVSDRSWLPNKGSVGFGIDFAVRLVPPANDAEGSGAVGEFFWDGAANTLFWVDPANQITAILFNIYRPFGKTEIQKDFRDAVYFREPEASALNKPPGGPDARRLSD